MKVMISGPITHEDKAVEKNNLRLFEEKKKELKGRGHVVLTPSFLPGGLTQGEYMDICLAMVRSAECLYMLKGWGESGGAIVEHAYARKIGKAIVYQELDEEVNLCVS